MAQSPENKFSILFFDPDKKSVAGKIQALEKLGFYKILHARDMAGFSGHLNNDISVVMMDIDVPGPPSIELLKEIREKYPHIPVIITTEHDDVETAVACIKAGAFDYLIKPVDSSHITSAIKKAFEINTLRRENLSLRNSLLTGKLNNIEAFSSIITHSRKMYAIFQYVEAIAGSNQPVIITGETGTGKELITRSIHELSGRKGKFIAVNIAGLDDTVLSDTLFGHRKGAYTGAISNRLGLVAEASGGTLFLDEIGDMSYNSQTKLLRLLEEEEYFPLGSDRPLQSNIRTTVATNHDLEKLISEGGFRTDLYFRLNTHTINVPPLRERREDIPLLFTCFLDNACRALKKKKPSVPPELFTLLSSYHWPGNVRELQSMVYDAVATHKSRMLSMDSFKDIIQQNQLPVPGIDMTQEDEEDKFLLDIFGSFPTLKEAESFLISKALKMSNDNQGIAASLLGISRQALNRRLKRKEKKS